jgi:hypothetical protein
MMVDRQTPTVESDEELTREAQATRETESGRDASPTTDATAAADRAEADRTRIEPPSREAVREGREEPARDSGASTGSSDAALFNRDATKDYQDRWLVIQTEFVDEPRQAVEKAESLVGEVMQALTESFAREHRDMEARWSGDREVSTEDLRLAIRRYRSFFNRLLSL